MSTKYRIIIPFIKNKTNLVLNCEHKNVKNVKLNKRRIKLK